MPDNELIKCIFCDESFTEKGLKMHLGSKHYQEIMQDKNPALTGTVIAAPDTTAQIKDLEERMKIIEDSTVKIVTHLTEQKKAQAASNQAGEYVEPGQDGYVNPEDTEQGKTQISKSSLENIVSMLTRVDTADSPSSDKLFMKMALDNMQQALNTNKMINFGIAKQLGLKISNKAIAKMMELDVGDLEQ